MNMTRTIKDDLLPKLRERYARRQREGKTRMLDELCEDYGYERKYAIKLLGDAVPAPSGRTHPGPARQYERIEPVVRTIWLAAEQPCGKRLAPALPLWLPHYQRLHGQLSAKQRELLRAISPATLDRLLAAARTTHPLRGRCGTKPGGLLKTQIPIRTGTWDVTRPGYLEADSVAHCGASLAGDFLWSLTYTDIATQWTEGRLEVETLVEPVSALYRDVWGPLMNFFLPGLKLKEKWREKSAWKKRYEPARTAYQRLMDAGVLGRRERRELRERYESLDPFGLKRELERGLKPILAGAVDAGRRPAVGCVTPVGLRPPGSTPPPAGQAPTRKD